MNIERLTELADSYGADLRRWPASERPFAESLIAADPAARAVLEQASELDALLGTSLAPVPSAALVERVMAGLPTPAGRSRWLRGHLDKALIMLGAGWAAAACAGVVAGVGLTTHVTADDRADAVLYQSTLVGVDDTEVLQ